MTYWCELLVSQGANFGELRKGEVRRIPLPRTRVNPEAGGADRIINAVAVGRHYRVPAVIVDIGKVRRRDRRPRLALPR